MINIVIGVVIGIVITILVLLLKKYLDKNHLQLDWGRIFIALIIIHLIYSIIGIIVSPRYEKPNGNHCKGFNFGINICDGDLNAE